MFSNSADLKEASKWDGKGFVSRQKLVEELQGKAPLNLVDQRNCLVLRNYCVAANRIVHIGTFYFQRSCRHL